MQFGNNSRKIYVISIKLRGFRFYETMHSSLNLTRYIPIPRPTNDRCSECGEIKQIAKIRVRNRDKDLICRDCCTDLGLPNNGLFSAAQATREELETIVSRYRSQKKSLNLKNSSSYDRGLYFQALDEIAKRDYKQAEKQGSANKKKTSASSVKKKSKKPTKRSPSEKTLVNRQKKKRRDDRRATKQSEEMILIRIYATLSRRFIPEKKIKRAIHEHLNQYGLNWDDRRLSAITRRLDRKGIHPPRQRSLLELALSVIWQASEPISIREIFLGCCARCKSINIDYLDWILKKESERPQASIKRNLKKISSSQGKGGDDRYDRIFYLTF